MFVHPQIFIELTETYFNYRKKTEKQINLPNICHKYNSEFTLFLLVIAISYCPSLVCFIRIASEHTGYKRMTEIISLK